MLRPIRIEDADLILSWRNNPAVRENMYTSHEITLAEHTAWLSGVLVDKSKQYFIFEQNSEPVGVIGFTEINIKNGTASWAFYSGKIEQRGLGVAMETAALNHAFGVLKLRKLNCEVLSFNTPVIGLHKRFGFKVEGAFKAQYERDGKYFDIIRLALSLEDWQRTKSPVLFKCQEQIRPKTAKTFKVVFDDNSISDFARLSGDHNLTHTSDAVAKKNGFESRIVHGALAIARLSKHLANDFPCPGTILLEQSVEFRSPIYPNQEYKLHMAVTQVIGDRVTISFSFHNFMRDNCITGECVVKAPIEEGDGENQ